MKVRTLSGLQEVTTNFSCYLVDVWGTLHNGKKVFPGIVDTLKYLRAARKNVVLFSNAPRQEGSLAHYLDAMGLTSDLYTSILTSGMHVRDDCLTHYQQKQFKRFYQIGLDINNVLHETSFERVFEIEKADFILLTGPIPGWRHPETYQDVWRKALEKRLLVLCGNSDKHVMIRGNRLICAGSLADMYEEMGGEVHWYGKPHSSFYTWALKRLGNPSKDQVLAIGDSLSTDIAGACDAKISSVLVYQTGIHASVFKDPAYRDSPKEALAALNMGTPTYLMDQMRWYS